ncbi:hypothetical protein GGD68_007456 [Paraburkholderia fungorum]|uniref:Uncharacterized protein n=1 Tax=Paraburkholderia fungorum TaxID=134537 RepID=A0AAW3V006_9BURK|nr:hypothetical protein [Paraburkholderia fungorum]MBB6204133.1 hypothetical protein [Paraburkholderia fungorum]
MPGRAPSSRKTMQFEASREPHARTVNAPVAYMTDCQFGLPIGDAES